MDSLAILERYTGPIVLTESPLCVCLTLWLGPKISRGSALEEVSVRLETKAELRE